MGRSFCLGHPIHSALECIVPPADSRQVVQELRPDFFPLEEGTSHPVLKLIGSSQFGCCQIHGPW